MAYIGQAPAADPVREAVRQKLYLDILRREPDAAGLEFWTNYTKTQAGGQITPRVIAEFVRIAGTKGEGPVAGNLSGILPLLLAIGAALLLGG